MKNIGEQREREGGREGEGGREREGGRGMEGGFAVYHEEYRSLVSIVNVLLSVCE